MSRASVLLSVLLVGAVGVPSASASYTFNYGNINANTVVYQQVTESTATDDTWLFGTPSVSGDSLTFSPANFGISAVNGGFDYMDGQLTTSLVSLGDNRIEKLEFTERGDWTLGGTGTAGTNVSVANTLFVRVTDIDGGAIDPITLTVPMTFTPNGGAYNLIDNRGQNLVWQGSTIVDVDALVATVYPGKQATKVDITFDNSLMAFSESGTIAYIKKKQIEGLTITAITPEPASLGLLMLGGLLLRRRR